MAKVKGISENYKCNGKKTTSIGDSKFTNFKKARHKKHGKKQYRGQGK